MTHNQGLRHQSVRDMTGAAHDYNGDWSALFDQDGIAAGDWNGRLKAWIDQQLGTTHTGLPGAMTAFAAAHGATSWDELGEFSSALSLDFAAGDFTGIKSATGPTAAAYAFTDDTGVMQDTVAGTPFRIFYYDGADWNSKGMPVFGSMTNLAPQSQTLGTDWNASNGSITDNDRVAPDGTTTAERFTTDGGGQANLYEAITVTNATQQMMSLFARYIDNQWFATRHLGFTNNPAGFHDVQNGVTGTGEHADIDTLGTIDVSDGWYECYSTVTSTDTGASVRPTFAIADGTIGTPAANQNIHLWGIQYFDDPAFSVPPPFYMPTTTAAVTRTADDPELDASLLPLFSGEYILAGSDWFDYVGQGTKRTLHFSDDGAGNSTEIFVNASDKLQLTVITGSSTVADITDADALTAGHFGWAAGIREGDYKLWRGGAEKGAPDISGAVPSVPSNVYVGHRAGSLYENGFAANREVSRTLTDAKGLAMSVV